MPATPSQPDPPCEAHPVAVEHRAQAVACLLSAGARVPEQIVTRFLDQAPSLGIDLALLAGVREAGKFRQVCLPVAGPGRTVMLFLSGAGGRGEAQTRERAAAVLCAVALADQARGVHLVQALTEPHEAWASEAYLAAGLRRIAELLYLSRPLRLGEARNDLLCEREVCSPTTAPWPEGITVRPLRAGEEDGPALRVALEASYRDTLDCPELAGLRTLDDIVAAHRGVGQFDGRLWWLVERRGEPEGCVLLNRCADQGCVELVYIGLSPVVRGLGLGRALMAAALGVSAGLERELRCAVDTRNTPALRIYEQLGFRETGRRVAFVGLVKDLPSRKS